MCSASAKEHYSNLAIPPANRLHISLDPSIKSSQHMVAVTAESSDSEAYCEQVDLMRTLMSQLTGGPFFCFWFSALLSFTPTGSCDAVGSKALPRAPRGTRHKAEGIWLIIQQGLRGEQHQTNDRDKPVNVTVNTRETFE